MAVYNPPTENLPIFDTSVFVNEADGLSIAEGDARYLRFPASQGSETINGNLTITGTTTATTINTASGDLTLNPVGSITCNGKTIDLTGGEIHNCPLVHSQNNQPITVEGKGTGSVILKTNNTNRLTVDSAGLATFANNVSVSGTLTTGTLSLTTLTCNTINATTASSSQIIGNNITTGIVAIGPNFANTGAGSVQIGRNDIVANNYATFISNGDGNTGDIRIGNGTGTKAMYIGGPNTTSNLQGAFNINIGGNKTVQIGNNSATAINTIIGTTNINTSGVQSTSIGNTTGTTTITGTINMNDNVSLGSSSADSIVPNGTLSKPLIIGYASQSSFSLSSSTNVNTYLGGTIQSSGTASNVATGTFSYPMSSVAPYTAGGGINLSAGTYMFWMAINAEDTASFDITDLRMGLSTDGTMNASTTEGTYVAGCPNLTCYFHKTDSANAAASDSENRVLSGCFYTSVADDFFPFWFVNNNATGGIDTITTDVIIVKIGSS